MPRGCDMRWFTTEEVCEILGRFERVVLVGDSMLRHIMGSINILLRQDIGYGAVTDWNFSMQERYFQSTVSSWYLLIPLIEENVFVMTSLTSNRALFKAYTTRPMYSHVTRKVSPVSI